MSVTAQWKQNVEDTVEKLFFLSATVMALPSLYYSMYFACLCVAPIAMYFAHNFLIRMYNNNFMKCEKFWNFFERATRSANAQQIRVKTGRKKNGEKCYSINKYVQIWWIWCVRLHVSMLCAGKKTISRVITFFCQSSHKLVGEGVVGFYCRCRSCFVQKSFAIQKHIAPNAFTLIILALNSILLFCVAVAVTTDPVCCYSAILQWYTQR